LSEREYAHADSVAEIYWDKKELFHRGFTSAAKQPRSVKQQKKRSYSIGKRREQSMRDRGLLVNED